MTRFIDDVPAWIAIPIRAVFLVAVLGYIAVGSVVILVSSAGRWFWEQVRYG